MMERQILLTVDHEIFGNGAGDVRQHVTEPTEHIAVAYQKHGMLLNVFLKWRNTSRSSGRSWLLR